MMICSEWLLSPVSCSQAALLMDLGCREGRRLFLLIGSCLWLCDLSEDTVWI